MATQAGLLQRGGAVLKVCNAALLGHLRGLSQQLRRVFGEVGEDDAGTGATDGGQ